MPLNEGLSNHPFEISIGAVQPGLPGRIPVSRDQLHARAESPDPVPLRWYFIPGRRLVYATRKATVHLPF